MPEECDCPLPLGLQEYILGALQGKTVILVTHQVEFLPAADVILVSPCCLVLVLPALLHTHYADHLQIIMQICLHALPLPTHYRNPLALPRPFSSALQALCADVVLDPLSPWLCQPTHPSLASPVRGSCAGPPLPFALPAYLAFPFQPCAWRWCRTPSPLGHINPPSPPLQAL